MKKIIYTLGLIALSYYTKAADLIVQENGGAGTYSSITGAITASSDGDRIIIHPKLGGDAWIGSLTINKSLELVSSQDTTRYKIDGSIDIIGNSGRKVSVINAELINGEITGSSSTGWKTEVNIISCLLVGNINLGGQYNATIVSNIFNGNPTIYINSGRVIGNELSDGVIRIFSGVPVVDTVDIIGNKVKRIYSSFAHKLNLRNNLIVNKDQVSYYNSITLTSGNFVSLVNNTIETPRASSHNGRNRFIDCNVGVGITIEMINNVFVSTPSSSPYTYLPEVATTTSTVIASYNYFSSAYLTSYLQGISVIETIYPLSTDGRLSISSLAINGADPSFEYYDLDLTRGDAGCYGGSYTLDNYFPITGSSRVFDIDMPFGIHMGGALNIKASGFDR